MTDEVRLYGISNCDTIKKAKAWLEQRQIEYCFHDYRKQGLEQGLLNDMTEALGWEAMLNRRGTTWRKLPEKNRQQLDAGQALAIMLEHPAIIKRPILHCRGQWHLGFNPGLYEEIFT